MGFSQQKYLSGLSFPPPGDIPDPGIESASPVALAMQEAIHLGLPTWEALNILSSLKNNSYGHLDINKSKRTKSK